MAPFLLGTLIGAGIGALKGHLGKQAAKKENLAKAFMNLGGSRYLPTPHPSMLGSIISGGATGALLGGMFGGAGAAGGVESGAAATSPVNAVPQEIAVSGEPIVTQGAKSANPWNVGATEIGQSGRATDLMAGPGKISPEIMKGSAGRVPNSLQSDILQSAISSSSQGSLAPSATSVGGGQWGGVESGINGLGKEAMGLMRDKDFQRNAIMLAAINSMKDDKKEEQPQQPAERTPITSSSGSGQEALAALIAALSQNRGGANRV